MELEAKENAAPAARAPVLGLKRKGFNAPAFVKKPALATGAGTKPAAPVAPLSLTSGGGAGRAAATAAAAAKPAPTRESRYFTVLYCKYQPNKKLRKNKSFADGVLEVSLDSKKAILIDSEGKQVSMGVLRGVNVGTMGAGSCVVVGNWEVDVEEEMEAEKFKSGEAFLKPSAVAVTAAVLAAAPITTRPAAPGGGGGGFRPPGGFKLPCGAGGGGGAAAAAGAGELPRAHYLHDPHAEGALVLNREQWAGGKGMLARGPGKPHVPVCPVVVDPYIGRHLRPHQVEGVRFLYEATQGLRGAGMHGCILADEMGLGKTLQVLALLWTLLKQGPEGKPAVRRAMVVTPSSLTQNWADEARKWLGTERMRVMVLNPGPEGKQQVVDFKHGSVHRVMVVSYETLRKHAAELAGCVDLLVCDEGHRLKSAQGNKTINALTSLNCMRRVLLTGTPVQNDLTEFYAMVNFVNPDSLGSLATFERVMAAPINRSRDRNASEKEKELGATRSAELARRVEQFVLRRTREINARYLPPLSNYVVFCKPTEVQLRVYSSVLGSSSVRRMLAPTGADFGDQALTVLTNLRKICNHPALYSSGEQGGEGAEAEGQAATEGPAEFDPNQSGKMAVLGVLLHESIRVAGDRVVVVSQSTAALDLVQKLCNGSGYKTARIDGGTDVTKRQDVVNSFNNYNMGQVFLVSTTAGGAGLNLTGANRLVLLDSHWNPAMDLQAMARVWRDGQKKACVVYRLLTTGTLDERMYQRQLKKGDMAATMMAGGGEGGGGAGGGKQAGGKFSKEELKQLFTLRTDTRCDTHDILQQAAASARAAAAQHTQHAQHAAQQQQRRRQGRKLQITSDSEDDEAAEGQGEGEGGQEEWAGGSASSGVGPSAQQAAATAASEFRDVSQTCPDAPLAAAVAAGYVTFVHLDRQQAVAAAGKQPPEAQQQQQGEQQGEQQQYRGVQEDRESPSHQVGVAVAAAAAGGAACADEDGVADADEDGAGAGSGGRAGMAGAGMAKAMEGSSDLELDEDE